MGLGIEDRLKLLLPGRLYYRHKIAKLLHAGEPELGILPDLVPAGCVALDVGANRGCYSYALAQIAKRVEAFEPHPALAHFLRRQLGSNVTVHEVALSNRDGSAELHIPQTQGGIDMHLYSSLRTVKSSPKHLKVPVRVATIDAFGFDNVGFIKIDTEGSDLEVIEGARSTITRCRPTLLVELMTEAHDNPTAEIDEISQRYNYDARILVDGRLADAHAALRNSRDALQSYNVVFTRQQA